MNVAGKKRKSGWRSIRYYSAWAWLSVLVCACPAQIPSNAASKPQAAAIPSTPADVKPKPLASEDTPANSIPVVPANAILPILINYSLWNSSLMEANVQINGALERCVFDTGLNACAVTPEASTRLKVISLPTKGTVTTLNETRTAPEAECKNLQFNQLKFDSLRLLVTNAAELYTGSSPVDSPSLWFGTPFLTAFQVTFDYTGHFLSLDRPDAPPPKAKGLVTLPLEVRDGRLYTRVTIPKGGAFLALINTGTMGTLIPASVATKLKLKPTKTFEVKWSGGKHGTASLITLPELHLGKLSQQEVPALYFEPTGDAEVDRTLGVLGADFLSHYRVIINIAHKKMILIPPPPAKPDKSDSDAAGTETKPPKGKPKK